MRDETQPVTVIKRIKLIGCFYSNTLFSIFKIRNIFMKKIIWFVVLSTAIIISANCSNKPPIPTNVIKIDSLKKRLDERLKKENIPVLLWIF